MIVSTGIAGFAVRGKSSPPYVQTSLKSAHLRPASVPRPGPGNAVTASGVLKPALLVSVGTQLSGTVVEVLADFNDPVKKDQPLARLAPDTFAAAVREAEAALAVAAATARLRATAVERARTRFTAAQSERAQADAQRLGARAELKRYARNLERKRKLARRGNLTARDLDDARTAKTVAAAKVKEAEAARRAGTAAVSTAQAEIRMAEADHIKARAIVAQRKAALDRARIDLAQTTIRAPIDGIVLSRTVEVGQTVAASLNAPTLFTVARDLRRMAVHARVDESDVGRIRVGQTAAFTVDAHPDRRYRGAVQQIQKAPKVIQNVVTYTIVIGADNKDTTLLPGMTALVSVGAGKTPLSRAKPGH